MDDEAKRRIELFGPNCIPEKKESLLVKFIMEFFKPMPIVIWIAIIIEVVSVVIEWPSASAVTGLVDVICLVFLQLMNVLVGFLEEYKAMKEVENLKKKLEPQCNVKREGKTFSMPSTQLVPGDIVCLGSGSAVPADCLLYPGLHFDQKKEKPLYLDCSAMTGESLPQKKTKGDYVVLATTVVRGEGEALVIATGIHTQMGTSEALMAACDEPGHFEIVLYRMLVILIITGLCVNFIILAYVYSPIPHVKPLSLALLASPLSS